MSSFDKQEKMRAKIAESFIEIAKTKHLSKISIQEIMTSLSMSRQKFYYYFEDINALIKWITLNSMADGFYGFCDDKNVYYSYLRVLTYFYDNKRLFRNLLSMEGDPPSAFEETFCERSMEGAIQHIGKKRITVEQEYALRIYCKGVTCIVSEWLRSNTPISPETLSEYCSKALPYNISSYYDMNASCVRE